MRLKIFINVQIMKKIKEIKILSLLVKIIWYVVIYIIIEQTYLNLYDYFFKRLSPDFKMEEMYIKLYKIFRKWCQWECKI